MLQLCRYAFLCLIALVITTSAFAGSLPALPSDQPAVKATTTRGTTVTTKVELAGAMGPKTPAPKPEEPKPTLKAILQITGTGPVQHGPSIPPDPWAGSCGPGGGADGGSHPPCQP
jgi:hypothetical protein